MATPHRSTLRLLTAMLVLTTASSTGHSATPALHFAWPASGKVDVEERVVRGGEKSTIAYTLEIRREDTDTDHIPVLMCLKLPRNVIYLFNNIIKHLPCIIVCP